jgi:hypothetical protein
MDALNRRNFFHHSGIFLGGMFPMRRAGFIAFILTDISHFNMEEWKLLDISIQKRYSDIFGWYSQAMKKANFSELIRPVHPAFYIQEETPQGFLVAYGRG